MDTIRLVAIDNVTLYHTDCFCSGWNHHACGAPVELCMTVQKSNDDHWRAQGNPEMCNTGMVDGWVARDEAIRKMKYG